MQGTSRTPGPVSMEASFSPGLDFGQLDEGLELVLTPLQLAAIFNDETIKNEVPLRKDFGGRQRLSAGPLNWLGRQFSCSRLNPQQ